MEIKIKEYKYSFCYSSDKCHKCSSVIGRSLTEVKDRGCCFYFPKFNLYDIQKMSKSEEGLKTLKKILENKNTEIYHYYIWAKGEFDEEGYKKYKNENEEENSIKDKTIFFKTCPFVVEGKGCTIPIDFRSNVCNFFICDEIKQTMSKEKADELEEEALNFYRFYERENISLEELLEEKKISLKDNFKEVIEVLKKEPLNIYKEEILLVK